MKALTNILSHLLMLLMLFIVACTEETAEVDNLSRGEQYVTVRMNIPGMKAAATRAEDGVIETIHALAFGSNGLLEVETITTVTNINSNGGFNGTFALTVPNGTTTIHFLANLPNDVNIPQSGSQVDVMTSLTTGDYQNLCYWGMANTWDGNTNSLDVTLYRNLAKISIKPSETDTEFNQFDEGQLKIAGLVNANQTGTLVPYGNSNFHSGSNAPNYLTLPNPAPSSSNIAYNSLPSSVYAFEHDNPADWDEGLYVICYIGDAYYKVALTSDGETPYDIIRNHEYIIYVSDVDDYAHDDNYRADTYEEAFDKLPINLDVQQEVVQTVELGISTATPTLQYSTTSTEQVTVTVTVPVGVQQLTLTAPGFTIESGDTLITNVSEGVYSIVDATKQQDVHFTLTLSSDAQATYTIAVEGEGSELVEVTGAETTISTSQGSATEGQTIWWQGAMLLDAADDATKLIFPYSYFTDTTSDDYLPVGSSIRFDYTNVVDDGYWIQAANPTTWAQIVEFEYGNEYVTLPITQNALDTITKYHGGAWDVADAAFVLQGKGRVLKKITLIPAVRAINANATTSTTLYYDSDEEQTVTIQTTIPAGVTTLSIDAADFSSVAADGDYTVSGDATNGYSVSLAAEGDKQINFTFTLNKTNISSAKTSTITFSDASGGASPAQVYVNLVTTPTVTFTNTGNQTIKLNGTPLSVTMDVPDGKTLSEFSITVSPTTGLAVTQGDSELALNEGVYTTTNVSSDQTFTFTPSATGTYTITFAGSGTDVNMPEENSRIVTLTVEEAAVTTMSVTPATATINMDEGQTTATLILTKPASVQSVKVNMSVENAFNITTNATDNTWAPNTAEYYFNNLAAEEATFTLTMQDGFNTAGEYTITFCDNNNQQSMFATATITVQSTPKLQYRYGGTTLYMKDSNGEANPTSLDVTVTVPDGSTLTELNITATGFTVTASTEGLSGSEGSYTYTGDNTVFTFTPTSAGTKTITFSGTNENLIVAKEIPVTVVDGNAPSEIVIWNTEQRINWSKIEITSEKISENIGGTIKIDVVADANGTQIQLWIPDYTYINDFTSNEERTLEYTINSSFTKIEIDGTGFTLKKIYIVPAPE